MKAIITTLALTGALLSFAQGAAAETVLKLSHPFTEQDSRQKLAELIAEEMDKRTGGEVKVEIYPNQQLFKAKQQYEGLRSNQIDMAMYPMPWLSGKVPLANVGVLPGVIDNPRSSLAWRGTPVWTMLEDAVARSGVHMVSIFWDPATYATKGKAPLTPDDLGGLKVRGMGKPLEQMIAAKGGTITSLPAADTYLAMQTGTLDMLFSTLSSFKGYRMYEVVDTIVDTGSYVAGGHFMLLGDKARKDLGADNLKILDEVMVLGEERFADWAEEDARNTYQQFKDKGVTVVTLTPEQKQAWHAAAHEIAWPAFKEDTRGGGELLDAIAAVEASQPAKSN